MTTVPTSLQLNRRKFLQGAVALSVTSSPWTVALSASDASSPKSTRACVGTYTGSSGNGEGIYLFDFDATTGHLSNRQLVAKTSSPSWIALHPSRKFLYAANEVDDFQGNSGSVSAFAIDPAAGSLQPINTISSEGAGPAYLSIDASGKFAFVANYGGGTIAVLPILASGALGPAVDVHRDESSLGNLHAADAPPGSFAISGHDAPHAHIILPDPANKFVLATDLGQDRIYAYRFNATTGKLTPASTPFATLPSGDGPRHLAFHPHQHWLYVIGEESSTVTFFHYDPSSGALAAQQTLSALPSGFAGTSFASEILIAPNGRTLYAANRLHDTIAVFRIGAEGKLTRLGEASTLGDYPVQCRIDPNGRFFFACNRRSDAITSFHIDPASGLLRATGQFTGIGSPGCITFA